MPTIPDTADFDGVSTWFEDVTQKTYHLDRNTGNVSVADYTPIQAEMRARIRNRRALEKTTRESQATNQTDITAINDWLVRPENQNSPLRPLYSQNLRQAQQLNTIIRLLLNEY